MFYLKGENINSKTSRRRGEENVASLVLPHCFLASSAEREAVRERGRERAVCHSHYGDVKSPEISVCLGDSKIVPIIMDSFWVTTA